MDHRRAATLRAIIAAIERAERIRRPVVEIRDSGYPSPTAEFIAFMRSSGESRLDAVHRYFEAVEDLEEELQTAIRRRLYTRSASTWEILQAQINASIVGLTLRSAALVEPFHLGQSIKIFQWSARRANRLMS